MAEFCSARSNIISPLQWTSLSPPFTPITDLLTYREDRKHYKNYKAVMNYIESDNYTLSEASPADNVDKIDVPVLVLHSEKDTRVNVRQSKGFNSKMKAAGKDITFIHWEEGNNFLGQQPQRIDFLKQVGTFLQEHLGE